MKTTNPSTSPSAEERLLELETKLIEQDHRLVPVLHYYFTKRRLLPMDDPRRDASLRAVLWRLLSPQTVATVGIGVASLFGLVLAYQANHLLSQQNSKIDVQNQLAEASRRASLIVELTSINERIDSYRKENTDDVTLPKSLIGRIVALSKSLRPYQYISYQTDDLSSFGSPFQGSHQSDNSNNVNLVERALSPERGQLLLTLANANINNFNDLIDGGVDFRYSDLRGVTLRSAKLIKADLQFADFRGANLFKMQFSGSDLEQARFDGASLLGVNFGTENSDTTRLSKSSFRGARLNSANFVGAALSDADFSNSLLFNARFSSEIISANFDGAIYCQKTKTKDTECEKLIKTTANGVPPFIDPKKWKIVEEKIVGHKYADEKEIHYVFRSVTHQ